MSQRQITSYFSRTSGSQQPEAPEVSPQSGEESASPQSTDNEARPQSRSEDEGLQEIPEQFAGAGEGFSTSMEYRTGATRTKRKYNVEGRSKDKSRPAKKLRREPMGRDTLEKIVVDLPVPFEMLEEPGPSGLQLPTSPDSATPSDDSSIPSTDSDVGTNSSSGLDSPKHQHPTSPKHQHPTSPVCERETARRVHSTELREGILQKLAQTCLEELGSRLLHIREEQDRENEEEGMETEVALPCSKILESQAQGTSPDSINKQETTPSPAGFDLNMPDTPSTSSVMEISVQSQQSSGPDVLSPSSKESEDNGINYNPTDSAYHPISSAIWNRFARIPYVALARTLYCIEQESSRLKITDILANFFRSAIILSPDDLLPSVYLCLNKLAPAYEDVELGLAESSLMKAIAECTGRSLSQIKADTALVGDLGIVAEKSRMKQNTMFKCNELTVSGVFIKLVEIAKMAGRASMNQKKAKIISLFVACRGIEARYLVRSLLGKLRVGLAEQSVLQLPARRLVTAASAVVTSMIELIPVNTDMQRHFITVLCKALAVACTKTPLQQNYPPVTLDLSKKSPEFYKTQLDKNALAIKTAYCEYPDYGKIIKVLLEEGIDGLPRHCHLTAGIPLKPMLAHPTKGIKEIFLRFESCNFTCEWKYDGERAQIHMDENGIMSIYSRNQENNTEKYPDIISTMRKVVRESVTSFILDCEAVAWNPEQQQILPFQILSTRKRKTTTESEIKVQVCVFAFDLLLLNNQPLVKKSLSERRALLREMFTPIQGEFQFAVSMDTNTMDEVQSFLDEAIKGKCEGLMVKTLEQDATYEIAKRSHNWLKLKKDYLDGMGDSIDVVVLGGYKGQGKRAGLYGGFLLACFDPNAEEFQTLCKIGTGFSDENLADHTKFFKKHIIPHARPYYRYDKSHTPDDWFDAVQVWEIKGADLTYSPTHWAAKGLCGNDQRGISLRFPRFLRIRDDKAVTDATSSEQIAQMYMSQAQIDSSASAQRNVEEDFY